MGSVTSLTTRHSGRPTPTASTSAASFGRASGTNPDIGAFELNQQSNPIVAAADGLLGNSDAGAELDLAMSRNLLIENADFIF